MSYKKVRGSSEKVSPAKTQDFKRHSPVEPAKKKLKYSK